MRVLMLSWEYPPLLVGGLARHVGALSSELARRGIGVDVLTRGGGGLPPVEEQNGVRIHRVEPYFGSPSDFPAWTMHLNFALCEAAVRLLRGAGAREEVLIHAHDWLVAYAGRFIKSTYRVPLVATIHATEHGRMNGIHGTTQQYINDVEWWLTYEAWRVIVCSHSMRREVAGLFGVPHDKLAVIPNGVEMAGSQSKRLPRERFAPPGEPLLFHIGRLVPEKGTAVLLEAMARVPKGRLLIAGSGPMEADLKERARILGLSERVVFAGFVDDAMRLSLFHHADVVVVPSTYEPFGIVALEAMAAGAPLVVSDTGGLGETVQHGVTGLKVRPGSPKDLAEKIRTLLDDPDTARRLAANARQEVERWYHWRSVAVATERVYREVLAGSREVEWIPRRLPVMSGPEAEAAPLAQGRYTV